MTTVSPAHVTTAIRAVLDHIDEHGLALPREIHTPDHYLGGLDATPDASDSIGLDLSRVTVDQVAAWEESLLPDFSYTTEARSSTIAPSFDYTRHVYLGQLPTGVRITLVARTPDPHMIDRPLTLVEES